MIYYFLLYFIIPQTLYHTHISAYVHTNYTHNDPQYNAESSATLMGRVPGPSETVALLKNQTAILSQNEAQKIYCMVRMTQ